MFKHFLQARNSLLLAFLLLTTFSTVNAQNNVEKSKDLMSLSPYEEYDNIYVTPIQSDTLTSSFVIWVKNAVKPHKHLMHSEQVYIIEGEAKMKVGDEEFNIKPGSYVFIPKNTIHSVITTSLKPLKALSIQAPKFIGKDRVFVE